MTVQMGPSALGNGFDVMRQCNFEIIVDRLDGLRLAIAGAPFPKAGVEVIDYDWQNTKIRLAGKANVARDYQIRVRDIVDSKIKKAIWAWFLDVYNPETGAIGKPSKYKGRATLLQTTPDGSPSTKYELSGIFPSEVDFGDGDMSANGPVEISVTFSVDSVKLVG